MTVDVALERLRRSPRLTIALRDAEELAAAAVRSLDPSRDAARLRDVIRDEDDVMAIASIHAIGSIAEPLADAVLLDSLSSGDESRVAHAAWVLAARRPSETAFPIMLDLVEEGGFTGMLAERTLTEWDRMAPGTIPLGNIVSIRSTGPGRSHLANGRSRDGIVVVQPFLHMRLDESGSSIGAGDAGGIASLLRSLGSSLAAIDEIDEVVTITRAEPSQSAAGLLSARLGDGHRIERIAYGTSPTVPWREAWQYRTLLEREMMAIGWALRGRRVVWHLRMADVGTLAASAVARRLGQPVVFTAAPDPHVVIDALEADGRIDRSRFGIEDAACQYWFRARMVERLSAQVDRLALLPRPTLERELIELVGLDADDLHARADVVPEGVDVRAADAAVARYRPGRLAPVVADVMQRIPETRRHLPWIISVGRLHAIKGPHRIVAAVGGSRDLRDAFNVVLIGGDLVDPSPDEQSSLDQIRSAAYDVDNGVVTIVGHVPPDQICDLLLQAAEHRGIYVCASDKEEFGLAIVEALAAGLVVVAPQRGGPRTYVDGSNGIICDTTSVPALTKAIREARAMAGDHRRMATSRAHIRDEMSVDAMAARLAGMYESLVPMPVNAA
ncbi:MAG: glycosyltransferase family 4 protein [Ilumatobacteraceae bacterium]